MPFQKRKILFGKKLVDNYELNIQKGQIWFKTSQV